MLQTNAAQDHGHTFSVANIVFCLFKNFSSLESYPTFCRIFHYWPRYPQTKDFYFMHQGMVGLLDRITFSEVIGNTSTAFQYPPHSPQHPANSKSWNSEASCPHCSTFCHLPSTICQKTTVRLEIGGYCGASLRLTWSVQVMLLKSVLKGSMAEQHRASTYPQIQDPGHRRDHCHSLKRTLERKNYPRL